MPSEAPPNPAAPSPLARPDKLSSRPPSFEQPLSPVSSRPSQGATVDTLGLTSSATEEDDLSGGSDSGSSGGSDKEGEGEGEPGEDGAPEKKKKKTRR